MNTPTQITLSNSLVINQSAHSQTNELPQLPSEVLAAKNIQFSKDSITLDVFIDKHWQTLRLGTTSAPQNLQKIVSANIQISPDGKQLNISPNSTTLTLNQPVQLQRLLNYVSTGTEVQSQPMDVQVAVSPSPKLVIDKLNASIAINKDVAQLLTTEQPLKVVVSTTNKGAQINIINRFADTVHSQPLSQTKLTNLLAALLPSAQLQVTPKLAILTHPQKSGSFTTPITNQQLAELPNTPIKVNLVNQADKLFIKTDTNNIKVTLNNSFSKPFNELLLAQKSNAPEVAVSASNIKVNPLLTLNSPIKSWLQNSFSDLKTRINDAVKYFENKPFATISKSELTQLSTSPAQQKTSLAIQLSESPLIRVNITQSVSTALNNNTSNILPEHFSRLPPIVQLTQLVKGSVSVWQTSANTAATYTPITNNSTPGEVASAKPSDLKTSQLSSLITSENSKSNTLLNPTNEVVTKGLTTSSAQLAINDNNQNNTSTVNTKSITLLTEPLSNAPSRSQMLQPIEAKLLSTLLKLPDATTPTDRLAYNKQLLSSQITDITNKATKDTPDLTRLINQAFNRMVSSNNTNPATIQREILATLQPTQLAGDMLQSSFTKGLEQVAVSILAAPLISQSVTPISFNNQTGLDALLQVLIPTFKMGNTGAKMLEQLQQAQVQALASEIVHVKNTLTQVSVSTPNQQPDTNPLAQFLLPMRLPPEAAQTEITLGQYKKPSAGKLEDKNVWFVRLNFDYAQLGQLQITAELMDKALDCQLLASSQEVSAIAHPHLDNLRSKLAKHGLQVGELNLRRGDANNQAFYKSHAIINIKV
ncbi:flagellar hook-length control protein FliK [Pseudoalteromonas sp. SR43-6]|uniref:flagellar hook-length control protein FliK n=1 Tax=unclassified Pseudoalteromonas TaxID=194690 RepID=UPI0015FE4C7E|nr:MULTISPECIES: flagellar hook-length control protein FliK [unclassified Pseudoalteromonas]MBB1290533.1 flagellar hook-length control protein FliK [Pseudoalteromonas sp. SR41-5]MBB1375780.1 flagellar hook-length control protein FliK [Pseudoalteromonas sp. SR43-6]MBB1414932.1 flagellar hook-length control protein FliK [Pseudoalteromonas sp. SG43-8]